MKCLTHFRVAVSVALVTVFMGMGQVSAQLTYTTGLDVWLDAQDINGNGDANAGLSLTDPVETWVNKGTTGASDATVGNQGGLPTYLPYSAPGGLSSLDFRANNQTYQLVDFMDSDTFSMFVVAFNDPDAGTGPETLFWDYGNVGQKLANFVANGTSQVRDGNNKNIPVDGVLFDNAWGVGLNILSKSASVFSLESGMVGSTTTASDPVYVSTTWEGDFRVPHIGGFPDGNQTLSFGGSIAEVLIYDHAVTGADRTTVIDYLQNKYDGPLFDPTPKVTIDRNSGEITLTNGMPVPVTMLGYSIQSTIGALDPGTWTSIAGNYDKDAPAPDGGSVDPDDNWTRLTNSASRDDLSEAELDVAGAHNGATLALEQSIDLGNGWIRNPTEDLTFEFLDINGNVFSAIVEFTGNEGVPLPVGDLDFDGKVESPDWVIFKEGFDGETTGLSQAEAYQMGDLTGDMVIDVSDLVAFRTNFEVANGAGSFATMLASVPEPTCLTLLGLSGILLLGSGRKNWIRGCGRFALRAGAVVVAVSIALNVQTAMADTFIYDFDNGQVTGSAGAGTSIVGQDNWVTLAGDITARDDLSALPGFSGNVSYAAGSGQVGRINDANFSFDTLVDSSLALEFTVLGNSGGNSFAHYALAYDEDADGIIQYDESGPALVLINGTFRIREAATGANHDATTKSINSNGQVWLARIDMDLSANGGDGSGSVSARQLYDGTTDVSGSTTMAPIDGLQNINLKISDMEGTASDPGNWDALFIRGNGGTSLDDLTINTDTVVTPVLTLQVNTTTGQAFIMNTTGAPVADLFHYQITSDGAPGSLNAAGFAPLEDKAGYGNGVPDDGIGWEVVGTPDSNFIAESIASGTYTFADEESVGLGSIFSTGAAENLVFEYLPTGQGGLLVEGIVEYVTSAGILGDYNNNGQVEQGDLDLVLLNWGGPAPPEWENQIPGGNVGNTELELVRTNWGNTAGVAATSAVPEPGSLALLGLALVGLFGLRRRQ